MVDVAVVGAGPAGSIAALVLARAGRSVHIYDRAKFPRTKPCGEGMLPGGVDVLHALGLDHVLIDAGAKPFHSIAFHLPERTRTVHFKRHGLALSRALLDRILLDAARAAGAGFHEGVSVDRLNEIDARHVIDARGRPAEKSSRFGFSAHIEDRAPSDRVDVFVRKGYEAYSSSVDNGRRILAIVYDRAPYSWEEAVADLPEWLRCPPDPIQGVYLKDSTTDFGSARILNVGDRLHATDPVAAQGMMLAFHSGRAAAAAILKGGNAADDYRLRIRPILRRSVWAARSLLFLTHRPRLMARVPVPQIVVDAISGLR